MNKLFVIGYDFRRIVFTRKYFYILLLLGKFDEAEMSAAACDKWIKRGNRKATGYVGFKDGKVQEIMLD